jgi:hypothetical protein
MKTDIHGSETASRFSRKTNLRHKGIFFALGGLVFFLQGLLYLNDTVTGLLLLALEVIYVFVFEADHLGERQGIPFKRKAIRFLVRFAALLIVFFLVVLGWVWLWRTTGVPPSFLLAATFALVGLILVVLSYAPVHRG